jgi:hypothetical protein
VLPEAIINRPLVGTYTGQQHAQQDRLIASCEKSKRQEFRATLRNYNGKRKIEIRVFEQKGSGDFVRTPRHLVIAPACLRDVIGLLEQAEHVVLDEGPSP